MRWREGKENVKDINLRKKRVFSILGVFILLFTSFTVMVSIIPNQAKAAAARINCTVYTIQDSYTSEKHPLINYGTSVDLYVDSMSTQRNRIYIEISPGIPSDAYIFDAELYLYCDSTQGGSRTLNCYQLAASPAWTEAGITWNWVNTNGLSTTGTPASITFSSTGWKNWDVTAMVQTFVTTPATNNGWCIMDSAEGTPFGDGTMNRHFQSRETTNDPYLYVEYCRPPTAQTNAATSVASTTARLNGQVTNDGGDDCMYRCLYKKYGGSYDNPAWTAGDPKATGQTFYVDKSSLTQGSRYDFEAQLKNSAGAGAVGSELNFLTAPNPVGLFTATANGVREIDLSWAYGTGGKSVYMEYATNQAPAPWSIHSGTPLGNLTGTTYAHKNIDVNTTYYYKAWPIATDGGLTSDGSVTQPYGQATPPTSGKTADYCYNWFSVWNNSLYNSCEGKSSDLKAALDGTGTWDCAILHIHWFTIDLGNNYTISKVRGRSNSGCDPKVGRIYVSRNLTVWGTPVVTDISRWYNTSSWQAVDLQKVKDGRYIKVEITATEDTKNGEIKWGSGITSPFSIFDAYVSNLLPEPNGTVNNSTPNTGATVSFDGTKSLDQNGFIISYAWNYGDGSAPDSQSKTTHKYYLASIYTPTLSVTDNSSSTNSTTLSPITVKQKITVVHNGKNSGQNYITWSTTATKMASALATDLGLTNLDVIERFDPSTGNWTINRYVKGGGGDFQINRWDHLWIFTQLASCSASFTPDGVITGTQTVTMNFTKSKGYSYITWSKGIDITAQNFMSTKVDLSKGNNVEIYLYNSTTNTWRVYNPSLPIEFQDNFTIHPYGVICVRAGTNHANIVYTSNN